jgi:hypothetical protein
MFKCVDNRIQMTRGDTVLLTLQITDSNGKTIELASGDKALFTVKKTTRDKEFIIQKDISGGVLELDPVDTAQLDYGSYLYDVQLTYADGDVDTIITPTVFSICEEVTF